MPWKGFTEWVRFSVRERRVIMASVSSIPAGDATFVRARPVRARIDQFFSHAVPTL
jgi:hypothetical protein